MSLNGRPRTFGFVLAALTLVGLLVHGRTLGYGFLAGTDDSLQFTGNELLNPPTLESLGRLWTTGHYYLYIPLTETIWWIVKNAVLLAGAPGSYSLAIRAVELAVHVLNAALVYLLATRLSRREEVTSATIRATMDLPAFAAAVFFLIHPAQTQVLGLVTGTKVIFGIFFSLLATLAADRYFHSEHGPRERAALASSALFQGCAMLCHPIAAVLPVIFFALATSRARLIRAFPFWLSLSALALVVGWSVRPEQIRYVDITKPALALKMDEFFIPIPYVAPWLKPFQALDALGFYLLKTVVPYPLTYAYERFFAQRLHSPACWAGIGATLACLVLFGRGIARRIRTEPRSELGVGVAWSAAMIFPVLGFVFIVDQTHSDVADRYLYPWLVGVALILSSALRWALADAAPRAVRIIQSGIFVAAGAAVGLCWVHQGGWSSDERLFSDMLARVPDSWSVHAALSDAHAKNGDIAGSDLEAKQAYEAYLAYHDARGYYPVTSESVVLQSYKSALTRLGRLNELIEVYRSEASRHDDDSIAHFGLGNLMTLAGHAADGVAELERARRIDARIPRYPFPLGEYLIQRYPERISRDSIRLAYRLGPRFKCLERMAQLADARDRR